MATNLSLDPALVERAQEVSGERTKKSRGHACASGIHRPPWTEASCRTDGQARFAGSRAFSDLMQRFAALPILQPDRQDHVSAAGLRNTCRRAGVQLGTIDALIAQPCIRHRLTLLTTDNDFVHAALHCPLKLWKSPAVGR